MQLDPTTVLTVLASMFGGGGLKLVFDYFTSSRQFNALDKDGLIKELNRIINDERLRCDESMAVLKARVSYQDAQIAQLQAQVAQLQGLVPV